MERLYIDNILCDMQKDTSVTLSIVSNLLNDVSKLAGNTTYTIRLPRTTNNAKVFGYADRMDSRSATAYRRHSARYYRNGVEIFKGADATLLSASPEGYEITIVFGCRPKFSVLVDNGMTLRNLSSQATITFVQMPSHTQWQTFVAQGYGYAVLYTIWEDKITTDWHGTNNSGEWEGNTITWFAKIERDAISSGEAEVSNFGRVVLPREYNHPCVSVEWILSQIQNDMGVEFRWTGNAKDLIDSLVIPCVEKKANELSYTGVMMGATITAMAPRFGGAFTFLAIASDNIFGQQHTTMNAIEVLTSCDLMVNADIVIKHKFADVFESFYSESMDSDYYPIEYRANFPSTNIVIRVTHTNNERDEYRIGNAQNYFVGGLYDKQMGFAERLTSSGIISVEAGDVISIVLKTAGYRTYRNMNVSGGFSAMAVAGDEVPYNAEFPIVENLPEIKVIDFVKFLCAVTGTFPIQHSADGVVEFAEYDVLLDNMQNAKDWTGKIIPRVAANIPQKLTYRIDGWARHNYYRWKEDERTGGNYDGDMVIDDETLDEERDVMTFPFAASDTYMPAAAIVPMYEKVVKTDGEGVTTTEYDYGKCEPRILISSGATGSVVQTKFGLNMQSILADKYKLISSCLADAKVIEETVMLSDAEMSDFDETIPVWLAQYGSYFAVLEIKSGSNGYSMAKMIQIKKDRFVPRDYVGYVISGVVTDGSNHLSGVVVNLGSLTTTTGSDGSYSFEDVDAGSYTLSATKSGYTFTPITVSVSADTTQNITMSVVVVTYTVSGNVTDGTNMLSGVVVTLGNQSVTSGNNGAFTFNNVEAGTYTLSATKSGYSFAPISLVVSGDTTQLIEMLPYDAEVEYLESSGTQYIDTGVVLSKTYKIEAEVAVLSSNSGFCFLLSANTGGTNYSNPISFNTSGYAYVQVGGNTSYTTINGDVRDGVMRSYVSEGNGSKMYFTKDNTTVNKSISGSLSTRSMYMFATNHSVNNATNFLSARVAKTKITIDGVLVRDYIPVRVGTTGYLYDKVSGTLFGNAGTDSFAYGNDK